jgi:homoserine kinase
MEEVTVVVPATTANLGPGFDCLGAALSLYNQFTFRLSDRWQVQATGPGAERIAVDSHNLVHRGFRRLYEYLDRPAPPVALAIELGVPLARGLGSSATALVGGLLGANHLAGQPLSLEELQTIAIALEGHPDNVVPALLGGCCLTTTRSDQSHMTCPIPWSTQVVPVVAIPEFELSTAKARAVLPATYSRSDVIFNVAHLGMLLQGLGTGQGELLETALDDRIHQPYRSSLIPGYGAVQAAAIASGAYGVVISGAGPSLLALTTPSQSEAVAQAMAGAWHKEGIPATAKVLPIDTQGARLGSH